MEHVSNPWSDFFSRMASWPKAIEASKRVRVGVTPSEVLFQRDKLRVLHYFAEGDKQYETPVLFVFALINRPYILDLRPGKSVVEHFVKAGMDTFQMDWGVPNASDKHLGMRDYILGYMDEAVDKVREHTGSDKVNLLGYCMGGSMTAMYTALFPDKIKNLIMLSAPVDWGSKEHLLAKWIDPKYFDVDKLVDTYGNMPADMLQSSFQLLKPVSNFVEKHINFYENMEDEKFLEDFFAMEAWLNDNIPVAGEMFREFVKFCMQENRLIEGKLRIAGKAVDLKNILCPLLNLTAQRDHLVPCELSLPLNDAVGSTDTESVCFPAGHIGMAVGSRAQRELWPKAVEWLAKRTDRVN